MQRFNICTKKTFQSQGKEQVKWNEVGTLTYLPETQDRKEGYILELGMFPDTKFYCFEQEAKEEPKPDPKPVTKIRR